MYGRFAIDGETPTTSPTIVPLTTSSSSLPLFAKPGEFVPHVPRTLEEAGLTYHEVESLVLKLLLSQGAAAGRDIATRLGLPFRLVELPLRQMKDELFVILKDGAPMGDYVYQLTNGGLQRAQRHWDKCNYCDVAPVPIEAYIHSVQAQSLAKQSPKAPDVQKVLDDLVLSHEMVTRIGEAMNFGLGFFLSGAPGNGKTSIAERVVRCYGESIWIPRMVRSSGEIIRLFDESFHKPLPLEGEAAEAAEKLLDQRWIRIRRPTVLVGGELTLECLELAKNASTGLSEAPVQMKSNCGALVIDDFGRQRIPTEQLINRWIVPLERRADTLTLHSGQKLKVPVDQIFIFTTNLTPSEVADEAFLRRIPYKVELQNPTENEYREVFRRTAEELGVPYDETALAYLMEQHYRQTGREPRFSHPRALLSLIRNSCNYWDRPPAVTQETTDNAVKNYFDFD